MVASLTIGCHALLMRTSFLRSSSAIRHGWLSTLIRFVSDVERCELFNHLIYQIQREFDWGNAMCLPAPTSSSTH